MNKIRNEEGYAIIVVLFLVMFTLFVGATFMTASISNAKQEKMVDSNNMAYVAAEMGLEYYISSLQVGESIVANEVYQSVIPLVDTFNSCGGVSNPDKPGCETVLTIDEIKGKARTDYITGLDDFLILQVNNVNNIIHPTDKTIAYELDTFSKNVTEDRISIQLDVKGSSSTRLERILTAWVNFRIPILIEGEDSTGTPIDEVTNPSDVFQYFIPPDAKHYPPCFKHKHQCESDNYTGTYFSNEDVTSDNNANNNLSGFTWLQQGLFDANNVINNLKITLVIESLKYKNNMNNLDGKVVLIGKANKGGNLEIGKIKLESNGTVCINLDGYPDSQLTNLDISGGREQLKYFTSKDNPSNLGSTLNNFERHEGSLISFVKECTDLEIFPPEGSETTDYEIILSPDDFDVDINY